jgi:hypothetical protein
VKDPRNLDALTEGFRFRVLPSNKWVSFLSIHATKSTKGTMTLGIEDVATGLTCPFDADSELDTALIVRGTEPDGTPFLAVAGFEQQATVAVSGALSRPGPLVSALTETFRRHGYAEAVVQVRGNKVELYDFGEGVQNPRGRFR